VTIKHNLKLKQLLYWWRFTTRIHFYLW